jgi:hypothetical protein
MGQFSRRIIGSSVQAGGRRSRAMPHVQPSHERARSSSPIKF